MERIQNQNNRCLNCGREAKGNFCSHCGQRTHLNEITVKELFFALARSFNLEKGVLYTAKQLSIRPGAAIREYIEGKRIHFTNPIKYLLLISAVAAFMNIYIPYEELIQVQIDSDKANAKEVEAQILQSVSIVYRQYFSLIMVASIPIISLLTRLFFYKHKVNLAKNMVLNTFLSAQSLVIYILFNIPILIGFTDLIEEASISYSILMVGYVIIGYISFFKPKNIFLAFFKGVLVNLFYYILVILLLGVMIAAIAIQQTG